MSSDVVRLTVQSIQGATVRVLVEALQAAGAVAPATPSFALALLSELQPAGWDAATLGATWHQDHASFLHAALAGVSAVRVVGGAHLGAVATNGGPLPALVLDVELAPASEAWTRTLAVGRAVTSAVYPQALERARWALCPGAPAAKECHATLRSWLPKGAAPVELTDAQRATLGQWLFHPSDGVPRAILGALPGLGAPGRALLGRVLELTRDREDETRAQAIECLAAMDDPAAADLLLTLVGAGWPADVYALRALGRLSRRPAAVDALLLEVPATHEREETLDWCRWRVTRSEEHLVRWLDRVFPFGRGLYLTRYTPADEAPAVAAAIARRMRSVLGADRARLDSAVPMIRSTAKDLGAAGRALTDALRALQKAKP